MHGDEQGQREQERLRFEGPASRGTVEGRAVGSPQRAGAVFQYLIKLLRGRAR